MTKYRVSYSGSDPIRLGKAGVFGPGTVAYVDEADAAEARKLAGFTVEAEGGGGVQDATPQPVVEKKEASAPVQAAAPEASRPHDKPADKGGEKHGDKHDQHDKKDAKAEHKGGDNKGDKGGDKKDEKKADAGGSTPPAGEHKG